MLKQLTQDLSLNKKLKEIMFINVNDTVIGISLSNLVIYISIDNYDAIKISKNDQNFPSLLKSILLKCLKNNNDRIDFQIVDGKKGTLFIESIKNVISNAKFRRSSKIRIKSRSSIEYSKEKLIEEIENFIQEVHDIGETLRVCREDLLSLSLNRTIATLWNSKEILFKFREIMENIIEDKSWEEIEFYVSMIIRCLRNAIYYLNSKMKEEEMKRLLGDTVIPNIVKSFDKLKDIVNNVVIIILKFMELNKTIAKCNNYPSTFFINSDLLENVQGDYDNLISFIIKIPFFENIITQLELIRYAPNREAQEQYG